MNRISEEEDKLFEAWPSRQESFVRDGLVDADEYARSRVKLLFVLKEVNDLDGGGWDLTRGSSGRRHPRIDMEHRDEVGRGH